MTRDEHMKWCKTRAMEYIDRDPVEAVTSMLSDLGKHDETKNSLLWATPLAMMAMRGTKEDARKFIEGFR